jgi:hemerythrin superfamily protein
MPRKTRTRKKQSTAKNVSKRVRRAARSISGATKRATQRAKRAVKGVTKRAARTAKRTVNPPATRHPLSRAGEADAVALLKADHKDLRRMLAELQEVTANGRRERLFSQVEDALKTHTTIEEEIFYPAFRDAAVTDRDRKLFFEAMEEHRAADTILPDVGKAKSEADVFEARAKVLKEIVEHHAEEEETDMFPRARKLLPPSELRRLGAEMAERKRIMHRPSALSAVTSLFSS